MEDSLLEGLMEGEGGEIELTDEQKLKVLKFWNEYKTGVPKLKECVDLVFPGADPRDKRGVAVRKFLASKQLQYGKVLGPKKDDIVLTEEQKEYIANHAGKMTITEIGAELFPGIKMTGFSKHFHAVKKYLDTLSPVTKAFNVNSIVEENNNSVDDTYRPPKTATQVINKINRYTNFGLDIAKINQRQKKEIESLINYLHCYRFISQISTYTRVDDRDLFESSFIRGTFDKPDLSSEEIDSYVLYSTEVVIGKNISERLEGFQQRLDQDLESDETLSMAIVESMGYLRDDHDKCVKRQQKILSDLTGTRKERISNEVKEKQSLVQLVEYVKTKEGRANLERLKEKRKQAVKNEIERLQDMDALKFEIFGVDPSEVT